MRFPIIKVKDIVSGEEHIVGTDIHDTLISYDDYSLHYYNMHNGSGTGEDEYKFDLIADGYSIPYVEFVSFEELEKIYEEAKIREAEEEEAKRELAQIIEKLSEEDLKRIQK